MASAVAGGKEAFALYPAAFGHLVASKAYQVTRAAATPRVLPRGLSLVTANSRVLLGGIVAVAVGTPIGAGLMKLTGPEWSLRLAFVVFAIGTGLALALSPRVDSSVGEVGARLSSAEHDDTPQRGGTARWSIGPRVVLGLRAVAGLRAFTGFLTLFLAFALAFWLLGLNAGLPTLLRRPAIEHGEIYLLRLAAFLLIIGAILAKNLKGRKS